MAPLGEGAEMHQRERATANYQSYPAPTSTRADTEFSVSRVCGAYAGSGDRTAEHRTDSQSYRVGTLPASEASEQYRSQYPPLCEAAFAAEWQANIGPYRTDVANTRVPEQTVSISPAKCATEHEMRVGMNDYDSLTAAYEQLRTEANQYVKTHPDEVPLMEAICYGQGNNPKLLSAGSCVQLVGWVLAELVRPNVVAAKAYQPLVEMLLSSFDISPARTKMQERLDNTMATLDDKHMGQPTNILEQLRLCWAAASELEIDPSRASSLGKRSVSCLDDRL